MQVVKVAISTVLLMCLSAQKASFTYGNHRVTIHDEEGKFQFAVGSKGSGPGCLDGPCDVTFGSDGLVYVTDVGNKRVCV